MIDFNANKLFSLQAARKFIYPVLRRIFERAEIFIVEKEKTALARKFDSAGIDIIAATGEIMTGLNSRCHRRRSRKPTFTVRKSRRGTPAEYDRILDNLFAGGLTPKYFVQAYCDEGANSAQVGIIDTNRLFHFLTYNGAPVYRNGDTEFFAAQWADLPDTEIWQIEHGALHRTTEIKIAV